MNSFVWTMIYLIFVNRDIVQMIVLEWKNYKRAEANKQSQTTISQKSP
jgi:hypothetical protein